ncbi:hypothetical protein LCGC14_1709810 [marine sediment metagenome]|uniref:Recombination endonuclease VII n=1 Tax=marine sediment metagenome TaxID=412755 RepID=A0A0F9I344_9ZZZZ
MRKGRCTRCGDETQVARRQGAGKQWRQLCKGCAVAHLKGLPLRERRCRNCGEVLPVLAFWQSKTKGDGYEDRCKTCLQERYRKYCEKQARKFANSPRLPGMKQCTHCKRTQRGTEFTRDRGRPDGLTAWCRECRLEVKRRYNLRKRTAARGITVEVYERMVEAQGGLCLICGKGGHNGSLAIDHDHKTGEVRGLLCNSCNFGIGNFKDSPKLMAKGAEYLEGARG